LWRRYLKVWQGKLWSVADMLQRAESMADTLFKLIFAVAAIMALSMLVYTCSPYAPLDQRPPPLETMQQNNGSPPPQNDGN